MPLSRRQVQLLSLDVFGVALERPVLYPQDVHGLVGPAIAGTSDDLASSYPSLRLQAERLARAEAAGTGHAEIGIADIGDHLAEVFDRNGHPRNLAREAIVQELNVEQHLAAGIDPECRQLHDDAQERGIPVAFVADSYLPRDFVGKLLHDAGLNADMVLVSSHEGVTKTSGKLFSTLAERADVTPERIVHLGPDRHADVAGAARAGARGYLAGRDRGAVEPSLRLGLAERSGLDSVALALAADRVARVGAGVGAADVGYYASGPLAVGFATWVGRQIDERQPDQVIFCGRAASLLRRLVQALEPELPLSRLHHLDGTRRHWDDPALDRLDRLLRVSGIRDTDRVLAVDLGWDHEAERWLREGLTLLGRANPVDTALCGTVNRSAAAQDDGRLRWAFGGAMSGPAAALADLAGQREALLDALVPSPEPPGGQPTPASETYDDDVRAQLVSGILAFADDLRPWLPLGHREVTAALVEPALRVVHGPTEHEARLLGWLPSDDPGGSRYRPPNPARLARRTISRVAPRRDTDPGTP